MAAVTVTPVLTPQGHLMLAPSSDAQALPEDLHRRVELAFGRAAGHGLLELGLREVGSALPPVFAFWRDFGARYVTTLCTSSEASDDESGVASVVAPSERDLDSLVAGAPPMAGGEYLSAAVLDSLWEQIDVACRADRVQSKQALQAYLKAHNPAWNLVGRVHLNLAENRGDEEAPFAFIATYTTQLSAQGRAQHLPLAEALREYAGAKNKARLLSLLRPVQQAA